MSQPPTLVAQPDWDGVANALGVSVSFPPALEIIEEDLLAPDELQ
jgi:hypothetical protein